jgi:hypothetical protein
MFTVTVAPSEVNAWSEARLSFLPKGEMLEFRQQLAAVSAMRPSPGAHLVATYTAADPTALIDAGNVLFYNVGLARLSAHTRFISRGEVAHWNLREHGQALCSD